MSNSLDPEESDKDSEEEEKEENEDLEEENTEKASSAKKLEVKITKKRKKKKSKKQKSQVVESSAKNKKKEMKLVSPRISSKSTFAQIAKELKAKKLAQMAYAAAMAKKRRKNRVLRDEEVYTDKDRAAAVNMGTRDIKQSLKMKKKQDKSYDCQLVEEADPGTLLALGNNELRSGDLKNALSFMNKALELNPEDKNGLVARSKCYLSLGDPQLALKDAETALQSDKTFVRAIFQKAEALYHLGDFEHSLMYYHRGHRLRPELECFRLGVQKAQEAIENTIGSTAGPKIKRSEKVLPPSTVSSVKTKDSFQEKPSVGEKPKYENGSKRSLSSLSSDKQTKNSQRRSQSAAPTVSSSSKRFLGELGADRLYLENLLKHPDLICSNHEAANVIKRQAEEGITFLKSRQEFWRQQKPNTSGIPKKSEDIKLATELTVEN